MFEKFDADGLVHIVGNGDYRKFDLAAVQQFVHGRKRLDARIFFKQTVSFGVDIVSADYLENIGHLFKSFDVPASCHSAVSDDGNVNFLFHNFFSVAIYSKSITFLIIYRCLAYVNEFLFTFSKEKFLPPSAAEPRPL